MSKIANDDLARSGTGCFVAVPIWIWQQWASKGYLLTCTHRGGTSVSFIKL